MTRDELLAALRSLAEDDDFERAHVRADELLITFIADADIADAYRAIEKWYA